MVCRGLGAILDMPLNDAGADAFLRGILLSVKTIAMVGASDKETRPSYGVFAFLMARPSDDRRQSQRYRQLRSWHGIFQDTGGYSRARRYGGNFPELGSRRGCRR